MNPYTRKFDIRNRHQVVYESYESTILNTILNKYEGRQVDFKIHEAYSKEKYSTKAKISNQMKQTDFLTDVAAMANTRGGLIIIGVREGENEEPPHDPIGIPPVIIKALRNRLIEWASRYMLPDSNFIEIKEVECLKQKLLVVDISQCRSGPAHFVTEGGGHSIPVREGEQNRPARVSEIERLIRFAPLSVAKQEAGKLATEFSKSLENGGDIYGMFFSDCLIWESLLQNISDTKFKRGLMDTGFQVLTILHPDLVSFRLDRQHEEPWKIKSSIQLNKDLSPRCIYRPAQQLTLMEWCDDFGRLDRYRYLSKQAGSLILKHGAELFAESGFWSGIDARSLDSPETTWNIILIHWQLENNPDFQYKSFFKPNKRDIFSELDEINKRGYLDPRANPFVVPFCDDLRTISHRILKTISS